MLSSLLKLILRSTISRWVTVGVVTTLLGGAGYWWYDTKRDLREEGQTECIQKINEETHREVVEALARKEEQVLRLQKDLREVRIENELARERERRANEQLLIYKNSIRTQAENDEDYREWADTPLPDGVADRLRGLRANSN